MATEINVAKIIEAMSDEKIQAQVAAARAQSKLNDQAKQAAELHARRRDIERAAVAELRQLRGVVAEKEKLSKAAHAAAKLADDVYAQANLDTFIASNKFQRLLDSIDNELLRVGDAGVKIDTFCDKLDELYETERRAPVSSDNRSTGEGFFRATMAAVTKPWSEAPSRARRLTAIRAAQAAAKLLILDAMPDELDARLESLRAALPAIVMEPVVSNAAAVATAPARTPLRYGAAAE